MSPVSRLKKNTKLSEAALSVITPRGIDPISPTLTGDQLRAETQNASAAIMNQRNRVMDQLQMDLAKEKEFMMNLPDEINHKIQLIMSQQLEKMKTEINQGTNELRDNILNLRAKAIELDEDRRRAAHEVNRLRSHLVKLQYEDDIRTNELLAALADDNLNRILPSSSSSMPEVLLREYSDLNFPVEGGGYGPSGLYSADYFSNTPGVESDGGDMHRLEHLHNKNTQRSHMFRDTLEGRQSHAGLQDFLDTDLRDTQQADTAAAAPSRQRPQQYGSRLFS
jgi:hypothetical protein